MCPFHRVEFENREFLRRQHSNLRSYTAEAIREVFVRSVMVARTNRKETTILYGVLVGSNKIVFADKMDSVLCKSLGNYPRFVHLGRENCPHNDLSTITGKKTNFHRPPKRITNNKWCNGEQGNNGNILHPFSFLNPTNLFSPCFLSGFSMVIAVSGSTS